MRLTRYEYYIKKTARRICRAEIKDAHMRVNVDSAAPNNAHLRVDVNPTLENRT